MNSRLPDPHLLDPQVQTLRDRGWRLSRQRVERPAPGVDPLEHAEETLDLPRADWSLDRLRPRLMAVEPEVRAAAATALGTLQDPRIMPLLCDALSDSHYQVKLAVAEALEVHADERAIPALAAAMRGCQRGPAYLSLHLLLTIGILSFSAGVVFDVGRFIAHGDPTQLPRSVVNGVVLAFFVIGLRSSSPLLAGSDAASCDGQRRRAARSWIIRAPAPDRPGPHAAGPRRAPNGRGAGPEDRGRDGGHSRSSGARFRFRRLNLAEPSARSQRSPAHGRRVMEGSSFWPRQV